MTPQLDTMADAAIALLYKAIREVRDAHPHLHPDLYATLPEGYTPAAFAAVGCEDCGLAYEAFPLDTVMPDADWLRIHPSGDGGLLCAGCIAKRAAAIPGMIVLFARLVDRDHHDAFRVIKNEPLGGQTR